MKFKNPANNHIEARSAPWLWTLLFGGFYFIAAGLWAPLLIWMLLSVPLVVWLGPAATVLIIVLNIIFATLAGGLLRSAYLRKGWFEVSDSGERLSVDQAGQTGAVSEYRKCPFCAEEIRREAIKCKHCGSAVEPIVEKLPEVEAGLSAIPPRGMSINDHIETVLGKYGASRVGDTYAWRGNTYSTFTDLVGVIKSTGSIGQQ